LVTLLSLALAVVASAQEEAVASGSKGPPPAATWLFRTDLKCGWKIDGEYKGVLHPDDRVRVALGLGEHLIEATPTEGGPRWEQVINVKDLTAQVFAIPLLAAREEAARKVRVEERGRARAATQSRGYWIDPDTNLTWAAEASGVLNWYKAAEYCRKLAIGSFRDWRLPTVMELERLSDPSAQAPKGGVEVSSYAWSTTKAQTSGEAYTFAFWMNYRSSQRLDHDGGPSLVTTTAALCVRP
jgi:hypothetical protein